MDIQTSTPAKSVQEKVVQVNEYEQTQYPSEQNAGGEREEPKSVSRSPPYLGLGALAGTVVLLVLAACVLIIVQGPAKVVDSWTHHVPHTKRSVTVPKPASWLSAILSAISVCLHIALTEGLNISWWRHVRRDDATVRDLYEVWAQGTSTWTALKTGTKRLANTVTKSSKVEDAHNSRRRFSAVALAVLFVATIPLNGFLLQSAVVVETQTASKQAPVTIPILSTAAFLNQSVIQAAPDILDGGVGAWMNNAMTQELNQLIATNADASVDLGPFDTTCAGSCSASAEGLGFAIHCTDIQEAYNIPVLDPDIAVPDQLNATYPEIDTNPSYAAMFTYGINVAEVSVTYNMTHGNRIVLQTRWKNDATCQGNFIAQTCNLDLATVTYPVVLNSGVKKASRSGLQNATNMYLDMDLLSTNPEVRKAEPDLEYQWFKDAAFPTAGLASLLAEALNASVNLQYGGNHYWGMAWTADGTFGQKLLISGDYPVSNFSCTATTSNITQQALAIANSITFQLSAYSWLQSIGSGNETTVSMYESIPIDQTVAQYMEENTQRPMALQQFQRNEYKVIWIWYVGTVIVTVAIVLFILPTFWGYSRLERKTTMSPFETARAFHAPVLYQQDSTVQSEDLIKRVGHMQLHRELPVFNAAESKFMRPVS